MQVDGGDVLVVATLWWFWWWQSKQRFLYDPNPQASPRIGISFITIYRHSRVATDHQRRRTISRWGGKCCMRYVVKPWKCRCNGPLQMGHRRAWSLSGPTVVSNLMPICEAHNKHMGTLTPRAYVTTKDTWLFIGAALYLVRWLYSKTASIAVVGVLLAMAWTWPLPKRLIVALIDSLPDVLDRPLRELLAAASYAAGL